MPKRLIFDSSVCRRIRNFVAAPEGPEIRPRDGLIPNSPHTLDGIRIDPPPSLPCAAGARPAATAAAAPPLDPPADLLRSHGVRSGGPILVPV